MGKNSNKPKTAKDWEMHFFLHSQKTKMRGGRLLQKLQTIRGGYMDLKRRLGSGPPPPALAQGLSEAVSRAVRFRLGMGSPGSRRRFVASI